MCRERLGGMLRYYYRAANVDELPAFPAYPGSCYPPSALGIGPLADNPVRLLGLRCSTLQEIETSRIATTFEDLRLSRTPTEEGATFLDASHYSEAQP